MKRPLKPEEARLWSLVTGTVHPLPGRKAPSSDVPSPSWGGPTREASGVGKPPAPPPTRAGLRPAHPPHKGEGKDRIEPNRRHRIVKEREEIGARLDLHGLTQDRARAVLEAFLKRAFDEGWRAVLVITGKGVQGDGVLRRHTPEWLAAPHLAHIVAGISEAHRRHGGEGALYVALKRKPRD
ncbi:MAG: DNA mismatch repair protein MutS [Phenylobacterium sp.]|uniref:Smr/MutS family protein n=1 Tax=Phenylobacterium sp. TaxID=1871053 RepID=UPI0025F6E3D0|nr:Smr/MutS family protein [Phenylobacterium sp.]MBI1197328.1 DNA mismatch repair protein MutS [Phenylobacterium sp.]